MKTMNSLVFCFVLLTLISCNREKEVESSDDTKSESSRYSTNIRNDNRVDRGSNESRRHDHIDDLSQFTRDILNSPTPAWLHIGEPASSKLVNVQKQESTITRHLRFRPFGSRNTIDLHGKKLTLSETWKRVVWVSINPSGTKIALQLGNDPQIRQVDKDGNVSEVASSLPLMNYDSERRWFFGSWQWISDNELIAPMNIQSTDGYSTVGVDIYLFDTDSNTLRRLDIDNKELIASGESIRIRGIIDRRALISISGDVFEVSIPSAD